MGRYWKLYKSISFPCTTGDKSSIGNNDELLPLKSNTCAEQKFASNVGRWQLQIFILMFLLSTPSNWVELGIELFGYKTDFWCQLPPNATHFSTNISTREIGRNYFKTYSKLDQVNSQLRTKSNQNQCVCRYGYEYNTSLIGETIISEWNLVCDKQYLLTITQSVTMFGNLLGAIVFGIAADKFGRRLILIISSVTRFLFGVASGFAPDITMFIVLRFFLSFFDGGIPGVALTMCLENLEGKWKLILPILFQTSFGVGFPIMALITSWLRNWRQTQVVLYTLSALTIWCALLSPESPKWNMAVSKKDEAKKTKSCFCVVLFTSPKLRTRTILSCLHGIVLFMNTYGFYQVFGEYGKHPFGNVSVQGITAVIGCIISAFIVIKYNRRRTLALTSLVVGLCSIVLLLLHGKVIVHKIIKDSLFCFVGIITSITEPLIGELFPTVLRNSGFGIFSIFGSVGAMIAPIIASLQSLHRFLPMSIFAFFSFMDIVFILLLPEVEVENLDEVVEDFLH